MNVRLIKDNLLKMNAYCYKIYSLTIISSLIGALFYFLHYYNKKAIKNLSLLAEKTGGILKINKDNNRFSNWYSKIFPWALDVELAFNYLGRKYEIKIYEDLGLSADPINTIAFYCFFKKPFGNLDISVNTNEDNINVFFIGTEKYVYTTDIKDIEDILNNLEFQKTCEYIIKNLSFNSRYQGHYYLTHNLNISSEKIFIHKFRTIKETSINNLLKILEELDKLAIILEGYVKIS